MTMAQNQNDILANIPPTLISFQHALWAHDYEFIFPFFKNTMYFRNVWKQFLAYQFFLGDHDTIIIDPSHNKVR